MENDWKEKLTELGAWDTGRYMRFEYTKLRDFISQELDKAREEGKREGKEEVLDEVMSWDSMQDMLPLFNDYLNELSKLKQ